MDTPWRIELFGGLRAAHPDRIVTRFQTQKTGALLAYLAFFHGRSHPREALIELLWPESPVAAGRNRLRVALSSLRRQLEPPGVPPGAVVIANRVTVQLNPAAVATDVAKFEAHLDAAVRASTSQERSQWLSDAIELCRGELLPGYFEEWVLPQRMRLAEAYLQALWQLTELLREANDLPGAVASAHRAVAADSLREEGHYHLIRLLAAAGEPEAAQRQYHELERLLAAELEVAPGAEIRAFARTLGRPTSGTQTPDVDPGARLLTAVKHPLRAAGPHLLSGSPSPLPTGTVTFLLAEIAEIWTPRESSGGTLVGTLADCQERLRSLFRGHGGHLLVATAETVCGAFGRASDAVAAAVAGQQALASDPEAVVPNSPRVRMAIHVGEVEPGELAQSSPVLRHARSLLMAVHPGQTVLSADAAGLLRRDLDPGTRLVDLGLFRLHEATAAERLYQVDAPKITPRQFAPLRAPRGEVGNLPMQFTRFFGREEEIARLQALIAEGKRVVTLTGPGGSGKSRLALEVAARMNQHFQGAVWFAPLVDLTDPGLIGGEVANSLRLVRSPGTEPLEQAVAALSTQRALLLLDNFEHLLDGGTAVVRTLRERVPTLTLLITSRQRLDLPGEREFAVMPLPVPVEGGKFSIESPANLCPPDLSILMQCASVRLFVDRAQAVRPDFQVTPANAAGVASLCARLEGLPLALELAAARVGVLTPAQILARLSSAPPSEAGAQGMDPRSGSSPVPGRFELLVSRQREAPPHHRSLRAALDWSHHLLSPELQRFFVRLSVFRGGWTLEAAEMICDEPEALGCLESLRQSSLVMVEEQAAGSGQASSAAAARHHTSDAGADEMRYRLMETLREYAAEQLTPAELAVIDRRHAEYFVAFAEAAEPQLQTAAQGEWLERLHREHDNLRAALAWAKKRGEAEIGLRLAGALQRFWRARGYPTEGREWLAALLALPAAAARTAARAKALNGAGKLTYEQGDPGGARSLYQESLAIGRELGSLPSIGSSLNDLGDIAHYEGGTATAHALYEESLAIHRELGDRPAIAYSLGNLGDLALAQGDLEAALSLFEEGLAIWRELGLKSSIARSLHAVARISATRGDYEAAQLLSEESLALGRELGNKPGIATSLNFLGDVTLWRGEPQAARILYSESLSISREAGSQADIGWALSNLGDVAYNLGDLHEARALYNQSLAIARTLNNRWGIGGLLTNLGRVALHEGNPAAGRSLMEESLVIRRDLGDKRGIAECLEGLAGVEGAQDQFERAARLFSAAAALRERIGARLWPPDQAEYNRCVAAVRAALDETVFATAWTAGRAIPAEQAVAEALGPREQPGAERVRQISPPGVSPLPERRPLPERCDLTDPEWEQISSFLPASAGRRGRPYQGHRRVINGILWVLRTKAAWRDLPARYGSWHTCHDRYLRWRRTGLWERVDAALRKPMDGSGYEIGA